MPHPLTNRTPWTIVIRCINYPRISIATWPICLGRTLDTIDCNRMTLVSPFTSFFLRYRPVWISFVIRLCQSPICPRWRRRVWTELDGTAVSRRSVAQVRVNSGDPGPCPKIRLKEPGPNGTSAGFQTDENRYYTLILAEKAEKR
jgi:hypothetical protein